MNVRSVMTACVVLLMIPIETYAIDPLIEGSGSADVSYDGKAEEYALQIGFDLDTDFSNPKNVVALFSKSSFEGAENPRRIMIRVDSTRTGEVEATPANKRFVFTQDGGQLYFPKAPCVIEIQRAYGGNAASVFKGRIRSCVVLSAGVEHTISARFEVLGAPSWKMKSSY